MKENKYDIPEFFEKYSQMPRSKYGLEAAGEWETLKRILPDFQGREVLDLGCGFGWHCQYAMEQGAKRVLGIDLSENMLREAREKNRFAQVIYEKTAMEDLEVPEASFDLVLSSLALHYVEDFPGVVKKVYACLKPQGSFVFSVEHPVFTSYGSQDWYYGEHGEILHFPVDNYYYEGKREAVFLGEKVEKYHRTLTTYIETLINEGFLIQHVEEPMPPKHMQEEIPGMKDEMRRPMMLIISAQKR